MVGSGERTVRRAGGRAGLGRAENRVSERGGIPAMDLIRSLRTPREHWPKRAVGCQENGQRAERGDRAASACEAYKCGNISTGGSGFGSLKEPFLRTPGPICSESQPQPGLVLLSESWVHVRQ